VLRRHRQDELFGGNGQEVRRLQTRLVQRIGSDGSNLVTDTCLIRVLLRIPCHLAALSLMVKTDHSTR
jgi:hypothetical protein